MRRMGLVAEPTEPWPPPRATGAGADAVRRAGTDARTPRPGSARASATTWQYRELSLPRGTGTEAARAVLVEAAEVERWELARLRLHPDGHRTIWLRRRILRVSRTA